MNQTLYQTVWQAWFIIQNLFAKLSHMSSSGLLMAVDDTKLPTAAWTWLWSRNLRRKYAERRVQLRLRCWLIRLDPFRSDAIRNDRSNGLLELILRKLLRLSDGIMRKRIQILLLFK